MSVEYRLPDLGEGLHEAEVVRWLVDEGASVKQDQGVLEVETDKAITEVPAPATGVIRGFSARPGDTVKVGDVLFSVETGADGEAGTPAAVPVAAAPSTPAAAPVVVAEANGDQATPRVGGAARATPVVRKLARELGVEIEVVAGTGPDGRVLAADVERAATGGPAEAAADPTPPPVSAPRVRVARTGSDEEQIPLSGIRRRVAEAMVESKRTIPHITGMDEIDATALMAARERLKARAEELAGVKLNYLPFIVKAAVLALKKFPMMRASVDMEARIITVKHRYNIGIATATPDGLIVPVVHDVDQKNLLQIAQEIQMLAEKARNRTIPLESVTGGCFTITNFGSLGSWHGIPIIRPGESAILGVGTIREKAVVRNGEIVIRPLMAIDVGADHRVVDGDVLAGFVKEMTFLLEDPVGLTLELV